MALHKSDLDADPIEQFRRWFAEARSSEGSDADAMVLATSTSSGLPSARMVILKSVDGSGFVFATNYRSRKAKELTSNPHAALVLHWPNVGRQVRVEGSVGRCSSAESDAIFDARPLGSRMSAIASPQSEVVPNRADLERRVKEVVTRHRHEVAHVTRPPVWGGFRVIPATIEFWQSGDNRLHDRFRYHREAAGWVIERLAP